MTENEKLADDYIMRFILDLFEEIMIQDEEDEDEENE